MPLRNGRLLLLRGEQGSGGKLFSERSHREGHGSSDSDYGDLLED